MSEDRYVERRGPDGMLRRIAVIDGTPADPRPPRRHPHDGSRHIGCPLSWFRLVLPVVHGKNELAVALYIYRLRVIRRSRTITVSNTRLLAELGIDRRVKYRTLKRLAKAGLITVKYHNKEAPEVTFRQ
jgi:hypothetical protein